MQISSQLGLELATVSNFFMNARRRSMDKWSDQESPTPYNPTLPTLPQAQAQFASHPSAMGAVGTVPSAENVAAAAFFATHQSGVVDPSNPSGLQSVGMDSSSINVGFVGLQQALANNTTNVITEIKSEPSVF